MVVTTERCPCQCSPPALLVESRTIRAANKDTDITSHSLDEVGWGDLLVIDDVLETAETYPGGASEYALWERNVVEGEELYHYVVNRTQVRMSFVGDGFPYRLRYRQVVLTGTTTGSTWTLGELEEVEFPADTESHEIILVLHPVDPPAEAYAFSYAELSGVYIPRVVPLIGHSAAIALSKTGYAAYARTGDQLPKVFQAETIIDAEDGYSGHQSITYDPGEPGETPPSHGGEVEASELGLPFLSPAFPEFALPPARIDTATQRRFTSPQLKLVLSDEYTTALLRARVDAAFDAELEIPKSADERPPKAWRFLTPDEVSYRRRAEYFVVCLPEVFFIRKLVDPPYEVTVRWHERVHHILSGDNFDSEEEMTATISTAGVGGWFSEQMLVEAEEGTEVYLSNFRCDEVEWARPYQPFLERSGAEEE